MSNPSSEFNFDLFPVLCGDECRIYCSTSEGELHDLRISLFRLEDSGIRHLQTRLKSDSETFVSFTDVLSGRYLLTIEHVAANGSTQGAEQEIVIDERLRLAMV